MPRQQQKGRTRSVAWVFTLNNYTDEEVDCLVGLCIDGGFFTYILGGFEVGEQKTPHLQGYAECSNRIGFRSLTNSVGIPRIHWEPRRGSQEQAITYCKKDGSWFEFGNKLLQGRRTDLDDIRTAIESGISERQLAADHWKAWIQYRRSFEAYKDLIRPTRDWASKIYYIWGVTGTGKSRLVHSLCSLGQLWVSPDCSLKWFDSYDGHEFVLFDDWSTQDCDVGLLLRVLDRYPLRVPVKGAFVSWLPRVIFITSNVSPDEGLYSRGSALQADALRRRVDRHLHLVGPLNFSEDNKCTDDFVKAIFDGVDYLNI